MALLIVPIIAIIIFFRFYIVDSCIPNGAKYFDSQSHSIDYIGDQLCEKCHTAEFHEWKKSDHFSIEQ